MPISSSGLSLLKKWIAFLLIALSAVATRTAWAGPQIDPDMPLPHKEEPHDPYMPRDTLAGPRGAACLSQAPAGSVQVNVDAGGMNICGDAANEPSIAIDPTDPNRIAVGWRQFDTIASDFRQGGYAFSTDAGQSWTFPGVLEPGVFRSDPVLGVNGFGTFFYSSLQGTFCIDVWRSADGGQTWPALSFAFGGDKQWIDVDQRRHGVGAGNIYQSWSTGAACQAGGHFNRSTDGGLTWSVPIDVDGGPVFGTVAVGPDGELYVAGVDGPFFFNPNFVVARSSNAKKPTETPTWDFFVTGNLLGGALLGGGGPNPAGLLGQVWIAVNHSSGPNRGHVYMLATVDPPGADPLDVMFTRSVNGGLTWSAPVRVNDDPTTNGAFQWFGTMSVAPNGRIDAVWNDTRDDPGNQLSRLYYAYSVDEGVTWTANVARTPAWDSMVGFPQQQKIGDYYDMVSDLTAANLIYSATFNGEEDVYFTRIEVDDCDADGVSDADAILAGSPDCNANGVPDECENDCDGDGTPDACELAPFGASSDCNENGVPDECEPQEDCNLNGTLDFCDLVNATSGDCNANDVPDECEVPPLGTAADCNENLTPDECEPQDDCNGNTIPDFCDLFTGGSLDCDGDGTPNECQLDGTEVLLVESFDAGLPSGWSATGLWHVTGACPRTDPCNPPNWAYYGLDAACNFQTGGANSGALTAPMISLPASLARATLTYCSTYGGLGGNSNVSGEDWAWLSINGAEIDDVSEDGQSGWEVRTVDLLAFAGQTIELAWNFDARGNFGNGLLGWQIDQVQLEVVVINSLDCNGNIVPDACDIESGFSRDCNANGLPDECEAPVPCPCEGTVLGDLTGEGIVNGGDIAGFVACRLAGTPQTPGCECADLDVSGVIDDTDTTLLIACLLGLGCP